MISHRFIPSFALCNCRDHFSTKKKRYNYIEKRLTSRVKKVDKFIIDQTIYAYRKRRKLVK